MRVVDELTEEDRKKLEDAEFVHETARAAEEEKEEVEEQAPLAVRRYSAVVRTVAELLARRTVDFSALTDLEDEEREALKMLDDVIAGRAHRVYNYAEDRLLALNDTLAMLGPVLSIAYLPGADALRGSVERVRKELTDLRRHLSGMEAAEEELFFGEEEKKKGEEDDDDDDGDEGAGDEAPETGDDGAAEVGVEEDAEAAAPPADAPAEPPTEGGGA